MIPFFNTDSPLLFRKKPDSELKELFERKEFPSNICPNWISRLVRSFLESKSRTTAIRRIVGVRAI
ncbi:hypothetical protein LEP1GSC050_2903 [Leptospira broomii serovar Hurstbridge str. 5399]|uniref:Uncharacterized protein n=1 Tax=Leptospira broomii serovar Hurstbridge str. 5399 TaxID=1049789 RepID=T0FB98_9LEPT|nr:hypothetical protein LEP1GSC050_2903 [Leptospira broomii serovar Hurstbridge str. 5399]